MPNHPEPMIKLQPGGSAPILSYNVPESTTYSGRNFIDLQLADSYFSASSPAANERIAAVAAAQASPEDELRRIRTLAELEGTPLSSELANLQPETVRLADEAGKKLSIYRSLYGTLAYRFIDKNIRAERDPRAVQRSAAQPLKNNNGDTDPVPPTLPIVITATIASPAANSTIKGSAAGATFDVTGTAKVFGDGEGTIGSVKVQVGKGQTYRQAALQDNGDWILPAVTVTVSGPLAITAIATHSNGTAHANRTINVTVELADATAPTVKIVSPKAGAYFSGDGGAASVVIEGTAADDRGVANVEVSLDSGAFEPATPVKGWDAWKATVRVPTGVHSVTARCSDTGGNQSTTSLTIKVDAEDPTLSIVTPLFNAQVTGTYLKGANLEVTGTAADDNGIARVEIVPDHSDVAILAQGKAENDWSSWTASIQMTVPGTHAITARCIDVAGNATEVTTAVNVTLIPDFNSRLKRLILVESYRLSSYLGDYGAGKTINTFSLLPGEKTKISVKTYRQTETTANSASSILDSFTEESSKDFEKSMASEQSDRQKYDESFNYKLSAEASASWGWGSASVSAGESGGTNSAREDFAKNISNAVQKHVAKASSKRDVHINTSYEEKDTTTNEALIEREIENINVSRTLNFVFRQMNQEYITLLHLVDVRIGYFQVDTVNGQDQYTYKEVTLPKLDSLLAEAIVPDKQVEVRNAIIHQLSNMFDYEDRCHSFVELKTFQDDRGENIPYSHYLRVKKGYVSTYGNQTGGIGIQVPGIIMAATKNVLRTDGIIVEALLGEGEALDSYSQSLQNEAIHEKKLDNELKIIEGHLKREELKIVENRDAAAAQVYAALHPPASVYQTLFPPNVSGPEGDAG